MCASRRIEDNLQEASHLIREAARAGAVYVQTPENTVLMEQEPQLVDLAAEKMEDSAALALFRSLARELRICLHIGSLAIRPEKDCRGKGRDEKDRRLFNRSVLISPKGEIIAFYDKIHLFDADLQNGESYRESDQFMAGNKAVTCPLPVGNIPQPVLGLTICYDLRFPQLYQEYSCRGERIPRDQKS